MRTVDEAFTTAGTKGSIHYRKLPASLVFLAKGSRGRRHNRHGLEGISGPLGITLIEEGGSVKEMGCSGIGRTVIFVFSQDHGDVFR